MGLEESYCYIQKSWLRLFPVVALQSRLCFQKMGQLHPRAKANYCLD